jgi:hypothetical protein
MTLCQMCAAVVLSLTLAISGFAGTIDCPGVVSQPPPTPATNVTTEMILSIVSLTY